MIVAFGVGTIWGFGVGPVETISIEQIAAIGVGPNTTISVDHEATQPPVKKKHGRHTEQVVQLEQVVEHGQTILSLKALDADMPKIDLRNSNDVEVFVHEMHQHGVDIPEDEQHRRYLNILPALLFNEVALPQPELQAAHGDDEKQMGHLVDVEALRGAVGLGGQDRSG